MNGSGHCPGPFAFVELSVLTLLPNRYAVHRIRKVMSTRKSTQTSVDADTVSRAKLPDWFQEQLDTGATVAMIVLLIEGLGLMLLGDGRIVPLPGPLRILGSFCGLFYLICGWFRYPAAFAGGFCALMALTLGWKGDSFRNRLPRTIRLGMLLALGAILIPGHQVLDFALRHRVERACGRARLQALARVTLREKRELDGGSTYLLRKDMPADIRDLGASYVAIRDPGTGPAYLQLRIGGGGFIEREWGYVVGPAEMRRPSGARRWADGLYTYGMP